MKSRPVCCVAISTEPRPYHQFLVMNSSPSEFLAMPVSSCWSKHPACSSLESCGALQNLLPLAIDPGSSSCSELQRMGTMCGCPSKLAPGEEPCTLCDMDNAALDMPVFLKAEDIEPYSPGLALLVNLITPTCQMVQAYLSSIAANTQECSSFVDELLAGQCGCPGNVTNDDEEVEFCQVCSDRNDVFGVPERDVTGLVKTLGADVFFPNSDNITCSNVYDTLSSKPANHLLCDGEVKAYFGGVCECPWTSEQRQCRKVANCNVDSSFTPDIRLDYLQELSGYPFSLTCQESLWGFQGAAEGSFSCFVGEQFLYACGCGVRPYLGTTTEEQQAALVWILRVAGLLSAIGSSLILWHIFVVSKKENRNRTLTMLQQLVCGMSIFDVSSSIANMFATLPIPEDTFFESTSTPMPTGVYGARGNSATCTAQGFFIQLGYTSAFYNLMLSVYYVLVIKKGMRETQIQRLKYFFHIPTLLAGFGLAFGGIPYYDNVFFICHIPPAVELSSWWETGDETESFALTGAGGSNGLLTVFSIVPISVVFFVGGVNMIVIYLHVRKQDRAANRWRMSIRLAQNSPEVPVSGEPPSSWSRSPRPETKSREVAPTNRLSNAVFWQAVFYMGSFLMAWPIYFYGTLNTWDEWENYSFWVVFAVLYPLQGFWNAIVYFRPRLFECFRKKVREWKNAMREKGKSPEAKVSSNVGKVSTSVSGGSPGTDSECNSVGQRTRNELHQDNEEGESKANTVRDAERLPSYFSRIDMAGSDLDSSKMESIYES
eukprot:scaffold23472_cov106-Cylindrotheca_fusiformis.AAC.1